MRSLNLDQLRALLAVVEHGSFSAAARRLNLTQPAVSLQIQELERRFGVRLIERMGKQAHPTVPGRELIASAQNIFRECSLADAAMRRFREGWIGRVRVATTLTAMTYLLPPLLRRLRLAYPGVDLVVTNMPTPDSVDSIIQNKADLALVTLPIAKKRLTITPLCQHKLVAIFPLGTRDVPPEITPAYVGGQLLLMEHTRSAGHTVVAQWMSGVPSLQEPMALGTVEALKSAVESNLGMAIVPEMAVVKHMSDYIVRPLRPPTSRTLALIEHRHKPNEPGLDIVRKALLSLRSGDGSEAATPRPRSAAH